LTYGSFVFVPGGVPSGTGNLFQQFSKCPENGRKEREKKKERKREREKKTEKERRK
jgi:hypothetical protein